MELKALTYVEIDVAYCSLTYGTAPCTAAVGVTGADKCFNTRNFTADCQDQANYTEGGLTLRFGIDCGYLPESIPCIPSLSSVSVQNAEVEPGVSIGQRSTMSATFKNHRHGDAGIDKYIIARSYNPFEQGTFWGKFRARNPYLEARPIRVLRGYLGMDLADFEVEHFVVDKFTGPDSNGRVTITGVDFMRLLSGKNSQAPAVSEGYLSADITATATSITLEPTGIGATYPASGTISVGQELMTFTRVDDVLTVVRGVSDTVAAEHKADDVAQIALVYTGQTTADVIYDLIVNYTPLDATYTDITTWQQLASEYSDTLYSATIVKPTPVETLINELVEQAGLVVYGDTRSQKVRFDVLRPTTQTGLVLNEDRIILDTFRQQDQPSKRYSQVWVFYNQRDVFKNLDEPSNFYSAFVKTPGVNPYASESVKKIFSRWIPRGARGVASDVASRAIARYVNPPRRFSFSLFGQSIVPLLGQTLPVTVPAMEDCFGVRAQAPVVITGVQSMPEGFAVEAEELKFDDSLVDIARTITIDYDSYNINLRELYDDIYSNLSASTPIVFVVESGVVVGSTSTSLYAIVSGDWPSGIEPTLRIRTGGYVVGRGADGDFDGGADGGAAIQVTAPLAIENNGVIGGGGGAGGGYTYQPAPGSTVTGRGGGGAGLQPGFGGGYTTNYGDSEAPSYASLETGGQASTSAFPGGSGPGNGGNLGQAGGAGGYTGGQPGVAVQGDSLVNWTLIGDIRGSRVG